MKIFTETLVLATDGAGTIEFTARVALSLQKSGLRHGIVTCFCRHTSCSLVIMENADPSARHDLHRFFDRLVPKGDPSYTHTLEGPDDATSHIKMALTRTSETVPFSDGRLLLGTWQGIFLWEHRDGRHLRDVVVTVIGEP